MAALAMTKFRTISSRKLLGPSSLQDTKLTIRKIAHNSVNKVKEHLPDQHVAYNRSIHFILDDDTTRLKGINFFYVL